MAQAKKKQSTKTAKKPQQKTAARKKACTKTAKCKCISNRERNHIFFITAMGMIACILLCAGVAVMIVSK